MPFAGSQPNERVDARSWPNCCTTTNCVVYHGDRLRTLKEWSQLSDITKISAGDDSGEGPLSQLGHPLYRQQVYAPRSCAEGPEDQRPGVPPASGFYYQQLDACDLRLKCARDLWRRARHQAGTALRDPSIGPIRAAVCWHLTDPDRSAPSGRYGLMAVSYRNEQQRPITWL